MKVRKELWFGFILMGVIVLAALYMLLTVPRIESGHVGLLMLSLVVVPAFFVVADRMKTKMGELMHRRRFDEEAEAN